MPPQDEEVGSDADIGGQGTKDPEEFEEWRALRKSTGENRANIIADIIGHPDGKISFEELKYMNPELESETIRQYISTLKSVAVISEIPVPDGEWCRDPPTTFYTITDDARELFSRSNLFREDSWKRQYDTVEKTPRINELEAIPRPVQ